MEFQLTLTQEDLNVLKAALQEMPYRIVAPLLSKLEAQLQSQVKKEKEK